MPGAQLQDPVCWGSLIFNGSMVCPKCWLELLRGLVTCRKRGWSRALLSLSPWPPALLRVEDHAARLSSPARFALKSIRCHLIPSLQREKEGKQAVPLLGKRQ